MSNCLVVNIDHLIKILIIELDNLQTKAFERELSKFGLTQAKFALLHEISCFGENPTPASLAHRVIYESHTISALVNRMEIDGLVLKHKDLKQKHMVRIELTEKGIQTFREGLKVVNRINKKLMKNLTLEEKEQLTSLLTKLRDNGMPLVYSKAKNLTPFEYKRP